MDDISNQKYVSNKNRKKSKRVVRCAVPMCGKNSDKNPTFVYHKFPQRNKSFVVQTNYFGKAVKIDRLIAWQNALKMHFTSPAMCVCSNHFEKEDYVLPDVPSNRMRLKANAVPSRNLPLTDLSIEKQGEINESRLKRRLRREANEKSRNKNKSKISDNVENVKNKSSVMNVISAFSETLCEKQSLLIQDIQISCSKDSNGNSSTPIPAAESEWDEKNAKRQFLYADVSVQVKSGDLGLKFIDLIKSDSDLCTVTGLDSFTLFKTIIEIAKFAKGEEENRSGKLNLEDKIILTFMKLKHNFSYTYLAVHFQISAKHCQRVFEDTITLLSASLKHIIDWSSREQISKNIPLCFEGFENVRVLLDCIEIFIQRPKNKCQLLTTSHYKRSETCKIMTAVTPAGNISFISKVYGGGVTNEVIFEQSELIKLLEPGDAVMVDRGFLIDNICQLYNIKCIRPPLLKKQKHFTQSDSILTQKIAKTREHVKRANQRIRGFKIVRETMPANLVPLLQDIFIVICAVVNLSVSILRDEKFME